MSLFRRRKHGIVLKCVLHVQHAYGFPRSTNQMAKQIKICGVVFAVAIDDFHAKAPYSLDIGVLVSLYEKPIN